MSLSPSLVCPFATISNDIQSPTIVSKILSASVVVSNQLRSSAGLSSVGWLPAQLSGCQPHLGDAIRLLQHRRSIHRGLNSSPASSHSPRLPPSPIRPVFPHLFAKHGNDSAAIFDRLNLAVFDLKEIICIARIRSYKFSLPRVSGAVELANNDGAPGFLKTGLYTEENCLWAENTKWSSLHRCADHSCTRRALRFHGAMLKRYLPMKLAQKNDSKCQYMTKNFYSWSLFV